MAKEFSAFFNSTLTDRREYNEDDLSRGFRAMKTQGVTSLARGNLVVTPGEGFMRVKVGYGSASVQGYPYELIDDGSGEKVFTLSAPAATGRIDRVVLRLDRSNQARNVLLAVVQGEEAENPEPPALTRDGVVYEISLAQVHLQSGKLTLDEEDITDERRDPEVCGALDDYVPIAGGMMTGDLNLGEAGKGKSVVFRIRRAVQGIQGALQAFLSDANGKPFARIALRHGEESPNGMSMYEDKTTFSQPIEAPGAKLNGPIEINQYEEGERVNGLRLGADFTELGKPLNVGSGGTGAVTVAAARNNLGLGNTAGALPVANGGTGAVTAATALAALGAAASGHTHTLTALGAAASGHTHTLAALGAAAAAHNHVATSITSGLLSAARLPTQVGTVSVEVKGGASASPTVTFPTALKTATNDMQLTVLLNAVHQIHVALRSRTATGFTLLVNNTGTATHTATIIWKVTNDIAS